MVHQTFFYFNIFQEGHFSYPKPIIKALVTAGHSVYGFGYEEYKARIESLGATYCPLPDNPELKSRLKHEGKTDCGPLIAALLEEAESFLKDYFSADNRIVPDCIIIESFSLTGALLAETLNVPLVVNYFMMLDKHHADIVANDNPMNPIEESQKGFYQDEIGRMTNDLASTYQLPKLTFSSPNTLLLENESKFTTRCLNLVSVPDIFLPDVVYNSQNCRFIGATKTLPDSVDTTEIEWLSSLKGKRVLYVSLGSRYENLTLYENIIDAVTTSAPLSDFFVVLSLGNLYHDVKPQLLEKAKGFKNIRICNYAPQETLLDYTELFITHGGMNSLREAVLRRVKCLFIPQGVDQFIVARRMHEMKVGINLQNKTPSTDSIKSAISTTLEQAQAYERRIEHLAQAFELGGGAASALVHIENFLQNAEERAKAV